jgi:hypothetical protein
MSGTSGRGRNLVEGFWGWRWETMYVVWRPSTCRLLLLKRRYVFEANERVSVARSCVQRPCL